MATGEAPMPDAASLPPRGALPRDIEIPALPGVGRTWYDHGGRYWARRAGLSLLWALVLLLIVLIDVGIFTSIRHSSPAGFSVLLIIDVVVAAAVLGYFAVRTVRRWHTPALPGRARTVFRAGRGRAGAVLSGFVQIGYLLAVLAVAVVFLFCPVFMLVLFLMSLLPEPLPERQARLWLAERLRERGHGTTAG
jgi:uncharacterized membrane protein YhaH (DUF805 family)